MKAFVFPGQGSQFVGMGKDLYDESSELKDLFEQANDILGYRITDYMFSGSDTDLKQTKVTQLAVFLHSVIKARALGKNFKPDMVAGHSLGEFSALVASKTMTFEDGLRLVAIRANAMQKACEMNPGTMAAVLSLTDEEVEEVCSSIHDEVVVAANYNCPGQIAISGTIGGIEKACELLKEKGARRTVKLPVGGAFHSSLMEPARAELEEAILATEFHEPICAVYQNVNAYPQSNPEFIKENLIAQLTAPVRWTQTVQNMIADGATSFTELGPGSVLKGLIGKINKDVLVE